MKRLLIVTMTLLVQLAGAPQLQAAGPQRAAPVVIAEVEMKDLAPLMTFSGTMISDNDAVVAAEVAARVASVRDIGERVQTGDTLASLDDVLARQTLKQQQAEVRKHQVRLEFFGKEAKRLKRLAKSNNAAQSQLDQVVSDQGVTRSELAAAQAALARAREQLSRMNIRAPFAGVIAQRLAKPGEWIKEGEGVVRLVDDTLPEMQVWVSQEVFSNLRIGDPVSFRTAGRAGTGRVGNMVGVADSQSHLYEVRIAPDSQNWQVGETARVDLPRGAARRVIAVPRDSLVIRRTGAAVFRVGDGNVAERVEVTPGMASGQLIEITGSRLAVGDRVVVRGGERLREGQSVSIYSAGAQ